MVHTRSFHLVVRGINTHFPNQMVKLEKDSLTSTRLISRGNNPPSLKGPMALQYRSFVWHFQDYWCCLWNTNASFLAGLTTDEVLAQSLLFFLAGYDTTANGLSFLMYNLALNPDIQEKLHEEIMNVAGEKVEIGSTVSSLLQPFVLF